MARLRGRSRRLVLDIGSSAMRLCELSPTKEGYQLTRYIQKEMVIDPSSEEEFKREVRVETLQALLKEAKCRQRKAIFGVPGQSVFTRPRSLPPVPEHKLTQIVRYEIQQQIPFSLDQIAMDYQVLNKTEAGGYDVLMTAIKVDVVEKQLDILRDAKRSAHTVDVCPIAAYNWLKHCGEFPEEGECVALIDMGATTTDIVIEKEGQFRFTRSLHMGGNELTNAISSNFGMSFVEAEKLKRERGFAPTGDPKRDGKGGEVIGGVLSRMVTEITRSFAYFRAQPGGGAVARVILTGGGACLRNIVPYLQKALGVEVRITQPLAGLAISPEAQQVNEHPEQATVALGLALRACQSVPIEINLIPPRVIEAARRKEQVFYWALSLATLALIMASTIPVSHNIDKQVKEQIKIYERVITQYDPSFVPGPGNIGARSEHEQKLEEAKRQVNEYSSHLRNLTDAMLDQTYWLDFLQAVNDARPRGGKVWLSAIETTVLGGPGNAVRPSQRREDGEAPPPEEPEEEPEQGMGMQRPGMPGMPGMMPGMMGGPPGREGGFGGPMGMMGGRGAPGRGRDEGFSSTGFPGIGGGRTGGGAGGMMGMMGGPMGMMGGGGPGGRGGRGQGGGGAEVTPPNGLVLLGYAEDPESMLQYKANLEATGLFLENGVLLDQAFAQKVPIYELDNANVSAGGTRGGGAMGGGGGMMGMMGGPMGMMGGGMMGGGGGRSRNVDPYAPQVVQFRMYVQWAGKAVPEPTADNQRGRGGGGPMGMMGGPMGMMGGGR